MVTLAPATAPVTATTSPQPSTPRAWGGRLAGLLGSTVLIVVPVFIFATLITFLLGAVSGLSPAASLSGDEATPERIAQINAELGIDQPLILRYLNWMGSLLTGDLGVSWYNGFSVSELIGQRLAVTASIVSVALVLGVSVGVLLGIVAAVNQGRPIDRAITAVTTVVSTLPPFVVSIGLIVIFSVWLHLLPSSGYVPFGENPGLWFQLIIMPAVALSLDPAADLARQLRTGLVHTLAQPYITGAVVRGLHPRRILVVHALRNGAGPAVAVLGMKIPALLGGAVVTETIFNMPGFGLLSADSALRGDVPVVQGTLVVAIVLVLAFNVLVNVSLNALQPGSRRATT
ncbi:ABC transporter permease [Microbacterium aerolatum]|uniref:ABC transporter permease n=1 Tax=Microbacterium aerolatum TaxID=153731 RepID=A0A511AJV0_9MICO|nr:ABC transporter permease [Microbacterium aerolatum]GEK87091.1 ABC transporter permease [Microbacterium aerolatum]GGB35921.1 ABC transporter permease [Microbacterium aerolatum]